MRAHHRGRALVPDRTGRIVVPAGRSVRRRFDFPPPKDDAAAHRAGR
jgi:hypothetical protein